MISKELLAKYNMVPLTKYKEIFGDTLDTELSFYDTFLRQTDHIPLKVMENFIENMAAASPLETIGVVVSFFKDVKVLYAEILTARKLSRDEVNRIKEEIETEQTER